MKSKRCRSLFRNSNRNMPRLSVDIDLTYIPFDERETALKNIMGLKQDNPEKHQIMVKVLKEKLVI